MGILRRIKTVMLMQVCTGIMFIAIFIPPLYDEMNKVLLIVSRKITKEFKHKKVKL